MKFSTLIITLFILVTNTAFAHEDHALGDGTFHAFYHIVLWGLFALVVRKAYLWFKISKTEKS